ncbi:hypothetical protein PFMALIP_00233 [Plasmodium falciparum MaliPS096_E11]|uniref:Uncharacterized protein n=1 Tax=Plasmodium falciparum MaliPS096_E11 TaxID=1036727 RepID=A0A024WXF7_PLAFA|nr:hypothetical protein PFMALIP_00233 [Plasmodium falciparum MaliPS096_E11]
MLDVVVSKHIFKKKKKAKINKIEPLKIHLDIFGIVEAIFSEDMFKDFHYDSRNDNVWRQRSKCESNRIFLIIKKGIIH